MGKVLLPNYHFSPKSHGHVTRCEKTSKLVEMLGGTGSLSCPRVPHCHLRILSSKGSLEETQRIPWYVFWFGGKLLKNGLLNLSCIHMFSLVMLRYFSFLDLPPFEQIQKSRFTVAKGELHCFVSWHPQADHRWVKQPPLISIISLAITVVVYRPYFNLFWVPFCNSVGWKHEGHDDRHKNQYKPRRKQLFYSFFQTGGSHYCNCCGRIMQCQDTSIYAQFKVTTPDKTSVHLLSKRHRPRVATSHLMSWMVQMRRGVDNMHRAETKMTAGDNLGTLQLRKVEARKLGS